MKQSGSLIIQRLLKEHNSSGLMSETCQHIRSKSVQSKYDYIKIKVWLGSDTSHYYILSRYILSRTLTSAKIPQDSAIKIALHLKKWLVDHNIFDLAQEDLEQHIFRCIREEGFTDVEISRFKLVNRFKQSRNPLVVFICGLPCDTKTRIAQELSHTMHVPNVLRTDDIEEILRCHPSLNALSTSRMVSYEQSSMMIEEYKKECQSIQKAMQHDVLKAFKDGKSIIIEGFHLDPEYIIQQFSSSCSLGHDGVTLFQQPSLNHDAGIPHVDTNGTLSKEVQQPKQQQQGALVIPILIHMDHDQYSLDSQSWILSRDAHQQQDQQMIVIADRVYSTVGEYLQQTCRSHAIPTVHVDMVDWTRALDEIHEYILQGIEKVMT